MNREDVKNSYTSADALPIKLIKDRQVLEETKEGLIPPVHAQIIPTNECNMNCEFCSCSERDKKLHLTTHDLEHIITDLKDLGCKAITWTGGGEPTMYYGINSSLIHSGLSGIENGLVTNGLKLDNLSRDVMPYMRWIRISHGDHRDMTAGYQSYLRKQMDKGPNVDWAISYVLGPNPNGPSLFNTVKLANETGMSHVRVVADLFQPGNVDMEGARKYLEQHKSLDLSRVIFQPRQHPTQGKNCYIGYLKPLVGADRQVYACCGVQYAFDEPSKDLPKSLSLGDALDLKKIYKRSNQPIDGSICKKCYYSSYNNVLEGMLSNQQHERFL